MYRVKDDEKNSPNNWYAVRKHLVRPKNNKIQLLYSKENIWYNIIITAYSSSYLVSSKSRTNIMLHNLTGYQEIIS